MGIAIIAWSPETRYRIMKSAIQHLHRNPARRICAEKNRFQGYRIVTILFFMLYAGIFFAAAQTPLDQLKKIRSVITETIDGKTYYIHKVVRGQTLYMISKAYGVDINDIIRENPAVKEGIKADQKIRIPVSVNEKVTQPLPEQTPLKKAPDSIPVEIRKEPPAEPKPQPSPVVEQVTKTEPVTIHDRPKERYNVALMLPLFLDYTDEILPEEPDAPTNETARSLQFLPFYEGFRMAVDSMERSGFKVILWVYDVDKDTVKTRNTLESPEMKEMDLIIGLLYHRNFMIVADFAKNHGIPIVNPITERNDVVKGNPMVVKLRPDPSERASQLARYLASENEKQQVLIIRNGKYKDADAADLLKRECTAQNLEAVVVDGVDQAIARLSTEKENQVIAFSDYPAYALDVTRKLYQVHNDYSVTLTGLPSWGEFDGLETEYLVGLKTQMLSYHMVDYELPAVKHFVTRYREVFFTDPPSLAFEGYDAGIYFLNALKTCGKNFNQCLPEKPGNSLLHNRFEFHTTDDNGIVNQHWEIYKYGNYRLIKVN